MVPRALVPWLFPMAVVFVGALFLTLPVAVAAAVVLALVLAVVTTIVFRRYQWVKSHEEFERPGNKELLESLDTLLWPRDHRDHTQDH